MTTDWLTVAQVAQRLNRSEDHIRTRCRVRDRKDAIPEELLDKSGSTYRIHRSYVERDAPTGAGPNVVQIDSTSEQRIQRLVVANQKLRQDLEEAQTENIRMRRKVDDLEELVAGIPGLIEGVA